MKVIGAGYSKTGTKTLNAALTILGYKVYDFMEHFWFHHHYWNKILDSKGTKSDFKAMYENVDAVTDCPAYFFWEEIHQAFPDSKIILTTRDEDSWYKSFQNQHKKLGENYAFLAVLYLSQTGRKMFKMIQKMNSRLFGYYMKSPSDIGIPNELLQKRDYRQHQQYCLQNAPKDKLLVYSVEDGWGPLCKFLGKKIPSYAFPRANVGGTVLDEQMASHPVALKMKKEMTFLLIIFFFIFLLIVVLLGLLFYFIS